MKTEIKNILKNSMNLTKGECVYVSVCICTVWLKKMNLPAHKRPAPGRENHDHALSPSLMTHQLAFLWVSSVFFYLSLTPA
jgi:hypothetical protein